MDESIRSKLQSPMAYLLQLNLNKQGEMAYIALSNIAGRAF